MFRGFIRRAVVSAAAFVLVAAVVAQAGQDKKFDVSGTWVFEVQTDAGSGTPTVTLKQEGEKLTGHYSSQTLGEADLTGTVKGSDLQLSFTADVQGNSVPVSYTATVESNTSMKGKISITGLGEGTFTGKKK
jgi:hypothetical protein